MAAFYCPMESLAAHGEGSWLLPDGPSVLDPYLACLMRWIQLYPVDDPYRDIPWARLPNLHALLEEPSTSGALKRAAAEEGIHWRLFIEPEYPDGDLASVTG